MKYLNRFNEIFGLGRKIENTIYTVELWRYLDVNTPDIINIYTPKYGLFDLTVPPGHMDDVIRHQFNVKKVEVKIENMFKKTSRLCVYYYESDNTYILVEYQINDNNYVIENREISFILNGDKKYSINRNKFRFEQQIGTFMNNNGNLELYESTLSILFNFLVDNRLTKYPREILSPR